MSYFRACKYFHTAICLERNSTPGHSSPRQLGNVMWKILGGKVNTQPQKEYPAMVKSDVFNKVASEGKTSPNSRRSKVLNKLFMRYITEIMATGQKSSEILGHGIEINRVKIAPNYKVLNVFWISKTNSNVSEIDKILSQSAGYLRSELSQLRIVGVIPEIRFIKDKHYANIVKLDEHLSKADFGEDHIPIDQVAKLKSEFELYTPLDEKDRQSLKDLEDNLENYEDPLPSMTHTVFGVNHSDILQRVKKSMKKSEALHRQSSTSSEYSKWIAFKTTQTVNENPINLGNERSQQEVFRKFLQQREILKAKAKRRKNEGLGLDYLKTMYVEHHNEYMDRLKINNCTEEEDYVADDWTEK